MIGLEPDSQLLMIAAIGYWKKIVLMYVIY
jgi:hypothetical protein